MKNKRKQVIDEDLTIVKEDSDAFVEQSTLDKTQEVKKSEDKTQEIQDKQKEKLDEAEQAVSKHSSRKKKITNWIFFFINIAIVVAMLLWQILGKGELTAPQNLTIHFWPFLVLLLVFLAIVLADTFTTSYLLKVSVGKWRPGLAFKVSEVGRYYDNVTPLGTGGQPFQITYLKSHDVPLQSSMSIPLAKMVFQQLVWVTVSFVCMIIAFSRNSYNPYVITISTIGFVLGSFVLFMTIFLSASKKVGKKLVVWTLRLLQKMKIVKNYEKQYEKVMKVIEDYQSVMKQYAKSPRGLIILLFSYAIKVIGNFTLPYFVFCTFKGFDGSVFSNFFIMAVMMDLAAGFSPLPGGSGVSEISFEVLFTLYFAGDTFWALLLWKFFANYVYLLQGLGIIIYDKFYGDRKYKWTLRRETLMMESSIFKQDQINKFRADRNKQRKAKAKNKA